jgi:hypothetical protein
MACKVKIRSAPILVQALLDSRSIPSNFASNLEEEMKKALVLALTGVCVVVAFATESDPSNTVGFINQTVTTGYSTFSACPTGISVAVPASGYIAGQGSVGDIIYERPGAAWVAYAWSPTWAGLNFTYNNAYLYRNNSGSAQSLVIAGNVIAEGTNLVMRNFVTGFNGFGNPLPLNIDLDTDDLGLDADGFNSGDIIYAHNGAAWVAFTYNGATYGVDFLAGESYLVKVNGAAFTYDVTVGAAPAAVTAPGVQKVSKAQSISVLN